MDDQIRRTAAADVTDTGVLLARVRKEIRRETSRRQYLRAAAALAVLAAGLAGYRQIHGNQSGFMAAAARDHRMEVAEGARRRWLTSGQELQPLLARYRISSGVVDGLVPAGFRLERGKQCGLNGERALHLVFGDGTRAISVFVRNRAAEPVSMKSSGTEELVSFRRGVVVTTGSPELCAEVARRLSAL